MEIKHLPVVKIIKELKLWENLKSHVKKNMKGKTLTAPLEKEINSMIDERKDYLKNLRE